ncbi:uncharacterized protein FIBRA_03097 [Fibroporia radiculosa]|uniref:Alpha/beta hydrolase fold-3 domain-containing protein n=1 Tax=Fibroporia radiculosa TaxID=599839 RepID=J4H278_9APHY|nr:uncharacterized protein FIBRA_03097 [Fibroporia radiculosa]CCM01049.1 predicted protein [Fibroporia radiculosa]
MSDFFRYRHQPVKTLYLIYAVLSLFVRIPYWTLRNLHPAWRPRRSWSISRVLLVNLYRFFGYAAMNTSVSGTHIDPKILEQEEGGKFGLVWIEPNPDLIIGEIKETAELNGVLPIKTPGFWHGQRGSDGRLGQRAGPDEKVIFEIHGSGWIMQSAGPKTFSAYFLNQMFKQCKGYTSAFLVEYRKAAGPPHPPKNPFPAALIDEIMGYNYLVNIVGFRPENILVTGGSSGGNLALMLARYLTTYRFESLPPPGALLLISPTMDWGRTHLGPNSSMVRNARSDMVAAVMRGYSTAAILGSLPAREAWENSWISPGSALLPDVKGRFANLPPLLIISGEAEMTLDGMRAVRDRVIADNGADMVTYIEFPDATHYTLANEWHTPESTEGYGLIAEWLEGLNASK